MSTEYKDGKITMVDDDGNTVAVRPYTISNNVILNSDIDDDIPVGSNMTTSLQVLNERIVHNSNKIKIAAERYPKRIDSEDEFFEVAEIETGGHTSIVVYVNVVSDRNVDTGLSNFVMIFENDSSSLDGDSWDSIRGLQRSALLVSHDVSTEKVYLKFKGPSAVVSFIAFCYTP